VYWIVVFAVLLATAVSTPVAAAQSTTPRATPYPALEGVLRGVQREYERTGTRLFGTAFLGFLVVEFETEAHAEAAAPLVVERLADEPEYRSLRPTSTTKFLDSTLAYTGTIEDDDFAYDTAVLVMRDGSVLHFWYAVGANADPLADLSAIAESMLAGIANKDESPAPLDLEAQVPGLADLPPGFAPFSEREWDEV
jgi:hypothetical protein